MDVECLAFMTRYGMNAPHSVAMVLNLNKPPDTSGDTYVHVLRLQGHPYHFHEEIQREASKSAYAFQTAPWQL